MNIKYQNNLISFLVFNFFLSSCSVKQYLKFQSISIAYSEFMNIKCNPQSSFVIHHMVIFFFYTYILMRFSCI